MTEPNFYEIMDCLVDVATVSRRDQLKTAEQKQIDCDLNILESFQQCL